MRMVRLAVYLLTTLIAASAASAAPLKTRDVIELWPAGVGHGFGIRDARQLPVSEWPQLAAACMRSRGLIK